MPITKKKSSELQVYPKGDRELWLISFEAWTIPIFCDPHCTQSKREQFWLFLVQSAVILNAPQFEALSGIIGPHAAAKHGGNQWWIPKDALPNLAKKAPGITPEYYFRWMEKEKEESTEAKVIKKPEVDESENATAFMQFMCRNSVIFDLPTVKTFMRFFRNQAVVWLLSEKRELDLGFCKLIALPLRSNWKQILLAKHPYIAPLILRKEHWQELKDRLMDLGFEQKVFDADCLALHPKHHHIYWTLECAPSETWTKAVEASEYQKVTHVDQGRYTNNVLASIQLRYYRIVQFLRAYMQEISRPTGKVGTHPETGNQIVRAAQGSPRLEQVALVGSRAPVAISNAPRFEGADPPKVAGKVKELQAVSMVLQESGDVRVSGADLVELSNGEGGAEGVPVPDETESSVSESELRDV